MARFLKSVEIEMHSAENTADRELADAELNDVSGGILPELIIVGCAAALLIGLSGPNVGTIEEQAKVLGMSHLL
jgi:lactobin A/cerein 7B family class IIb bacteriocin